MLQVRLDPGLNGVKRRIHYPSDWFLPFTSCYITLQKSIIYDLLLVYSDVILSCVPLCCVHYIVYVFANKGITTTMLVQ